MQYDHIVGCTVVIVKCACVGSVRCCSGLVFVMSTWYLCMSGELVLYSMCYDLVVSSDSCERWY